MGTTRLLLWLAWTGAGLLMGFGMAFAALTLLAVVMPHCGVACDDTLPELVAAIAAYGAWALTAATTSLLAWRHLSAG